MLDMNAIVSESDSHTQIHIHNSIHTTSTEFALIVLTAGLSSILSVSLSDSSNPKDNDLHPILRIVEAIKNGYG